MTYARDLKPGQLFFFQSGLWRRLEVTEEIAEVPENEWSWTWFRLLLTWDLDHWAPPERTTPFFSHPWQRGELIDMSIPYDGDGR